MEYQIPESWKNQALLAQPISLETTVLRAMAFHGALVVASKHPDVQSASARHIIVDMLDHLEAIFEDLGLERPSTGWRGEVN